MGKKARPTRKCDDGRGKIPTCHAERSGRSDDMQILKPFEIETQPAHADIQFLEDRLYDFNERATGIRDGTLLAIFVRDERNQIEAGLYGWTWGGSCRIDKLWVRDDQRR